MFTASENAMQAAMARLGGHKIRHNAQTNPSHNQSEIPLKYLILKQVTCRRSSVTDLIGHPS